MRCPNVLVVPLMLSGLSCVPWPPPSPSAAPPPQPSGALPPATAVAAPAAPRIVGVSLHQPPAPLIDPPTPRPTPDALWVPGWWVYSPPKLPWGIGGKRPLLPTTTHKPTVRQGSFLWFPGVWAMPPRAGARWVPYQWVKMGMHWHLIEGRWQ